MKNKMLNSHCHGNEHRTVGGTHPSQTWSRHFLDSLGTGEENCLHVPNS